MKLLVDAGNSAIKLMLADEQAQLHSAHLEDIPWSSITEVLVATVADSAELDQLQAIALAHGKPVIKASVTESWQALNCAYEQYHTLGIDRWLAVIGAYDAKDCNEVLIIDAGTAMTIDALKQGQHLGGLILPGLHLTEQSIVSRAQKVFSTEQLRAKAEFGTSTPEAVKNGALVSALGTIEYAKKLLTLGDTCNVILTGGDGLALHTHLKNSIYRPHLVFEGLLKWYSGKD